jgi:nucleotidyltransferase/DNA polymerase involved in DNA repair
MSVILHIDLDAFFAAVEQLDNPAYRCKPVIVGADPKEGRGRGVVSTASYEARKYGIHSAMPISTAYKLCPQGIFLPPRMKRYSMISDEFMGILSQYTPLVESVGIDEAFLDCTGSVRLFGNGHEIAKKIQMQILKEIGITSSIGIAVNKSLAKIASDLKKPNGIIECPKGGEAEFLYPLQIGKLWGVGKVLRAQLNSYGLKTIGDLASLNPEHLHSLLGDTGLHLWKLANGIDNRPVLPDHQDNKSISEEHTFFVDTSDENEIKKIITGMADRVTMRLRESNQKARTVTMKIRFEEFETYTRRRTFPDLFDDMATLKVESIKLFESFNKDSRLIRLIGIGVSQLHSNSISDNQISLFPQKNTKHQISEKLLDGLRIKYGKKVSRASTLEKTDKYNQ